ncbi:MAG: hypothetical protein NC095_00880 [Muribaculum sp.]|nr:hypothetical protein [Muribaculum sp.]
MKNKISVILTAFILLSNMSLNAEDIQKFIVVEDIKYDYDVDEDSGFIDCIGTLSMTVNVPSEYAYVRFDRSGQHLNDSSEFGASAASMYEDAGTSFKIIKENISWGTYFKASVVFPDGDRLFTPIYCVDDYIEDEDLAIFRSQNDIDEVFVMPVIIKAINKTIIIESNEKTFFNVTGIDGKTIYSGYVFGIIEIPVSSPISIVNYQLNNKIITKKLICK